MESFIIIELYNGNKSDINIDLTDKKQTCFTAEFYEATKVLC